MNSVTDLPGDFRQPILCVGYPLADVVKVLQSLQLGTSQSKEHCDKPGSPTVEDEVVHRSPAPPSRSITPTVEGQNDEIQPEGKTGKGKARTFSTVLTGLLFGGGEEVPSQEVHQELQPEASAHQGLRRRTFPPGLGQSRTATTMAPPRSPSPSPPPSSSNGAEPSASSSSSTSRKLTFKIARRASTSTAASSQTFGRP